MTIRDSGFDDLMARVRSGDDAAETLVFRRFVHRLIALAAKQFDSWMHKQADVENIVLSAYKSFFLRNQREEYDLAGWDALWSLLVIITLHKCTKRRKHLRAARRDLGREVAVAGAERTRTVATRPGPHSRRGGDPHRHRRDSLSDHDAGRPAHRGADPHGLHGPGGGGAARLLGAARSAASASVPSADSSASPILEKLARPDRHRRLSPGVCLAPSHRAGRGRVYRVQDLEDLARCLWNTRPPASWIALTGKESRESSASSGEPSTAANDPRWKPICPSMVRSGRTY